MHDLFSTTKSSSSTGSLIDILTTFREFGKTTVTSTLDVNGTSIPVFTNQFWTSKQRAAHSLHEISYRACFKPQLPRFFIERLTREGDTVYDPFMGRGTTLLESGLLKRHAIGCDTNPLSQILLPPRFHPPTAGQVAERLQEIDFESPTEESKNVDLLVFFHPKTLRSVVNLRSYLASRVSSGTADKVDQWIQMVASNRLTGHSAGFFSVYTLPPNQSVSVASQQKINAKRNQSPAFRDVPALILKKTKSLLRDYQAGQFAHGADPEVIIGSANNTPRIKTASVDLIVTSPPFLDVINYRADNWLRCWMNHIDSSKLPIWQIRDPDAWIDAFKGVFKELSRVLKPSATIAFEVGEVKKKSLNMEEMVIPAAASAGLKPDCIMINAHKFTKTSNCWGITNGSSGTNTNRVVLLSAAR